MAITKLGNAILVKKARERWTSGLRGFLLKYAAADFWTQFRDDLENQHFSKRILGDIPEDILEKLRDGLKNKLQTLGIEDPNMGPGRLFGKGKYLLTQERMWHLYKNRILNGGLTAQDVTDGLKNTIDGKNVMVEPSYKHNAYTMAIHAPRPSQNGDTDISFFAPQEGYAKLVTTYPTYQSSLPAKLGTPYSKP